MSEKESHLSRRQFLKGVGGVLAGASLMSFSKHTLPSLAKSPMNLQETTNLVSEASSLVEPWISILDIAKRTPSPHNVQPWKLHINGENRAELFLDHSRLLPAEDPTHAFVFSAMGMFVYAVKLIGQNMGMKIVFHKDIEFDLTKPKQFSRIGEFEIMKDQVEPAEFSNELFMKRRTSRLELEKNLVCSDVLNKLKEVAKSGNNQLLYTSDSDLIDDIMDLNIDTVVHDMNDKLYHGEITDWFRYSEQEAFSHKDGLSSSCMALSPKQFRFFTEHPRYAQIPLLGSIVKREYRKSLGGAPQLAILCGKFFDTEIAFGVGEMFLRLWLEMSRHDIYMHPFGNLITNSKAKKKLIKLTGAVDPWIVFRFGQSSVPAESYRLESGDLCV